MPPCQLLVHWNTERGVPTSFTDAAGMCDYTTKKKRCATKERTRTQWPRNGVPQAFANSTTAGLWQRDSKRQFKFEDDRSSNMFIEENVKSLRCITHWRKTLRRCEKSTAENANSKYSNNFLSLEISVGMRETVPRIGWTKFVVRNQVDKTEVFWINKNKVECKSIARSGGARVQRNLLVDIYSRIGIPIIKMTTYKYDSGNWIIASITPQLRSADDRYWVAFTIRSSHYHLSDSKQ